MKKAVLYARVSTENQQKEGTIQSQVVELKRQVIEAGDVLVKEYVDDGHSGAKLDRPALSQLRADLKTNLFDTVYFLNTDRIARDVTYQNIIVAEILKYKKQIIINGKDYIHNPENKFELTVLGAVSELERAKIIERSLRGKIHRLRQGFMLGNGYNIYGYTFIPRSQDIPSKLIVVEKQAKVVKQIFEMYAIQEASWATIIRSLEENGSITQMGKKHWPVHALMRMLRNSTYSGIKYFNTRRLVKEPSHSLRGIKYGKKVFRDRSEWIGVKVPAIVPKELFDKAQVRLDESKNKYRHPRQIQLLSNFMRCGECDRFCVAYQRYLRHYHKKDGKLIRRTENVYHKVAYKCNRRHIERVHIKSLDIKRCNNPEVSAKVIEPFVFKMIEENMLSVTKLKKWLDKPTENSLTAQRELEKQLKKIDQTGEQIKKSKRIVLDDFATGRIDKDMYIEKSLWQDNELNKLSIEKKELLSQVPTLHKLDVVDASIRIFCGSAKSRFDRCKDFNTKRQFLLDYIEKIIFVRDKVTICGSIPIQLSAYRDPDQTSDASKIEFSICDRISRDNIHQKIKMRV